MRQAALSSMALVRLISGSLEILAGLYILRRGSLRTALRVNAMLGLAGPVALVAVSAIGAVALRSELRPARIALLAAGVILTIIATRP